MGALGHYLEEAGLPTTQISLIRLHTEKIKPPRALWVPFELGRPFGPPNQPEFQLRVLTAALRLLEAPSGPVLEDFPEDEPETDEAPTEALACPISLPRPAEDPDGSNGLGPAFLREIDQLATWYDLAVRTRGRTTFGLSGLDPKRIGELLVDVMNGRTVDKPRPDLSLAWLVKMATEDLKAYYLESVTVQPGRNRSSSRELLDWFWGETTAGRVYFKLRDVFKQYSDPDSQLLANLLLVPRTQAHRSGS